MKQKIQITSKNIGEIFAIQCVKEIKKTCKGTFVVYLWQHVIRHGTVFCDCAYPGDWLVQDDSGFWYVDDTEKGDKQ